MVDTILKNDQCIFILTREYEHSRNINQKFLDINEIIFTRE